MTGLHISSDATGYYAYVENSDSIYRFAGKTMGDQADSVELLQQSMEDGFEALRANAAKIFSNIKVNQGEDVMQYLFNSCNQLYYEADMIYATEEGDPLLAELEAAAEELAEVLAEI